MSAIYAFTVNALANPSDAYFGVRVFDDAYSKKYEVQYNFSMRDCCWLPERYRELNEAYFGNAMSTRKAHDGLYYTVLPGYRKRYGVFKLQKSMAIEKDFPNDGNGPRVDLIFDTKEQAEALCQKLISYGSFGGSDESVLVLNGIYEEVVAVAYKIAYDTGSQPSSNGKSKPAQKHVFCKNPWKAKPAEIFSGSPFIDQWNVKDEDESKGIKTSALTEAGYDVTCMSHPINPGTHFERVNSVPKLWTNGTREGTIYVSSDTPTEHELNGQLGAAYCPVSD